MAKRTPKSRDVEPTRAQGVIQFEMPEDARRRTIRCGCWTG